MCGGGSPPPPPDYTAQLAKFAADEGAKRQSQAKAYNDAVAAFSNSLTEKINAGRTLKDEYGSYQLKDYNNIAKAKTDLSSQLNLLSSLNFTNAKPNFDSVVQSPYGSVSVTVPTLNSVDYTGRDALLSDLRSTMSYLNDLNNQYLGEEEKIRQAGSKLTGGLASLKSGISNSTIANLNSLNEYQRQLDQYKADVGSFYSPIADVSTVDDVFLNQAKSEFGGIEAQLKDLFAARKAEEQRIKDYEAGILAKSDEFDSILGGLTIADEAKINSLQKMIDDYQRTGGRFSSLLNFDLSQELGDVQSVEDRLRDLTAERQTELNNVRSAQNNYLRLASDLARGARTASFYDQGTIDDLIQSAATLRNEMSGFSSKLPADFKSALDQIAQAETATTSLSNRRNDALNRLVNRYDLIMQGAGDIAAYDETALRDRLDRLSGLDFELGRFSGGRADDVAAQFEAGMQQIDTRLRDLNTKRSQLEKQAQQMLANIKAASYTTGDQAASGITEAEKLKSEIDLYNAQQAIDEISAIMERLNAEKARLASDASAVSARQSAEQNEALRAIQGMGGDINAIGAGMTAQEYLQLLQKKKQEEDALKQSAALSSFANALGVTA